MNLGANVYRGSPNQKENVPPSCKIDTSHVQRTKPRTVLGVLSENEQHSRSLSEASHFSKHSSLSDSSQLNFLGCPSGSSHEVYVEEACEVVLTASGQEEVHDTYYLDAESDALQKEDMRLLLELSSGSSKDVSMRSDADESSLSEGEFSIEYAEDIHQHLREREMRFQVKPYLQNHPEITDGMRTILVDWLDEVVQEYRLQSETLHLAVNYVDRFLSVTKFVRRGKLQLIGITALLIASKYEEIFPPSLNGFVCITDCTYTRKQLLQMEYVILKFLAFEMAAPTANQFLRLFMCIHPVCAKTENLALYLSDLSLLEMDPFLLYAPSMVAAGAYCLAAYTIDNSLWPDSLKNFTGYTLTELKPCLIGLHKLYVSAESHPQQAIRNKYSRSKYSRVSLLTPPAVLSFL